MFRRSLAIFGNLPGLCLCTLGPLAGLFYGHLHYPHILLSNLLVVPSLKPTFGFVTVTTVSCNVFLWIEVLKYTRRRAPDLAASLDAMISCIVFGVFPGALLVVFFPLDEGAFQWFLHCAGAAIWFGAMGLVGVIYAMFVETPLTERALVAPEDAWWRRVCAVAVCFAVLFGAGVRPLHLKNPAAWAWPLLGIEIVFCLIALFATVLGNWQLLGVLDKEDPVAFVVSSCSKVD